MTRFGRMFSCAVIVRSATWRASRPTSARSTAPEGYNDTQETNYLHNVDYRKQHFALERLNIIRRHLTKPISFTRLLDVGCGTGWFLEVVMQEGFAVSGLEVDKETPGADHSVVAMEILATSGLRNARLATLSSHSHRRRLRGTQRIYTWHSWALALAHGARCVTGIARIPGSQLGFMDVKA
jgi:SAM-dependent methyltransferase